MSDVLTTREAARVCGVSFRTVLRWIERGLLHSYQLPGRGDHRVPIGELHRFMRDNGIPDQSQSLSPARRILIVDDELAMVKAIQRVLHKADFETAVASNGFEAGSLLYTFKPGVMILDLRMPGIDGIDVLRFLKHAYLASPLKTLVVSGDTETRLQEAMAMGAHGLIRKPFVNADLLATVEQMYVARS